MGSEERENAWQERLRLVGPRDLNATRGERACKTCEGSGFVTDGPIREPWSSFKAAWEHSNLGPIVDRPVKCEDCEGMGTHISSLEVYTAVCNPCGSGPARPDGAPEPEKPCRMCDGSGYISTSPPGEPWSKVMKMTLGEALEAKLGVIEPAACPVCGGSGERRA